MEPFNGKLGMAGLVLITMGIIGLVVTASGLAPLSVTFIGKEDWMELEYYCLIEDTVKIKALKSSLSSLRTSTPLPLSGKS